MANKLVEFEIAEDLKDIVKREVEKLKKKTVLEKDDLNALYNLSKTYTTLMSDLRETLKSGLLSYLTDDQLDKIKESASRPRKAPSKSKDPQ